MTGKLGRGCVARTGSLCFTLPCGGRVAPQGAGWDYGHRTKNGFPSCRPALAPTRPPLAGDLPPAGGGDRGIGLFSATFCAYIRSCRRKPDMAINTRRNKPFGPGGSTRRLHQFQESGVGRFRPAPDPSLRGRNRIDEGVKDVLLLGMVPPLPGHFIVANDNYAPVALAA